MYSIDFGNLFHLRGRKVALLLFFCFGMLKIAQAQKGNFNYFAFSEKKYYFGITLGYNSSNYNIVHNRTFILNDSIRVLESVNGPGFNLGIVTNLNFGNHFDVRFLIPTLSFAERRLEYTMPSKEIVSRSIESVFVEFPLHFRYKSKPYHDTRIFVVGGAKYSLDLASNSRSRQAEDLIRIFPNDFVLEYGVGFQIFFPYFILSPEIKFSHGLMNLHDRNPNLIYSRTIDKLYSRGFTISLHFEG